MGVGAGLYMYDVVVKNFTFAILSPDEFLFTVCNSSTRGSRGFLRKLKPLLHVKIKVF